MAVKEQIEMKDDEDVLSKESNAYELALSHDGKLSDEQKEKVKRLEFSPKTKKVLAQRVGYHCSHPNCKKTTIGPGDQPGTVVVLGEAAHIVGAVKKTDGLSPRADILKTDDEIKSIDNGIWLCRHHHKLVDSKTSTYTVKELKKWKKIAEERQAKLMEIQESNFIEEYIFPNIEVDKGINTDNFRNSEWCLLAYLLDTYDKGAFYRMFQEDDDGRNFISEYQNWMSGNSIDSKVAGIRFQWRREDVISDIREIVNKLTGLIKIDNDWLDYGKEFDNFCEKLLEEKDALEKIKSKLSKI